VSERLDQPTGADEGGDNQARTRARDVARDEGVSNLQALQRVLYRSAKQDPTRRFHALNDKLTRSDVMWQAWVNVATNHGAPGVDGVSIDSIEAGGTEGVGSFLDSLAAQAKAQSYRPQPLRRVHIPKAGKPGETRPLGIPALADRVLMSAAKLVLEPIFEADFSPVSFGFRPKRSAHDALEVIRQSANSGAHRLGGHPRLAFTTSRPARGSRPPPQDRASGSVHSSTCSSTNSADRPGDPGEPGEPGE
jgi:hypothetical protein